MALLIRKGSLLDRLVLQLPAWLGSYQRARVGTCTTSYNVFRLWRGKA